MAIKALINLDDLDHERPVLIAGPTASGKSALALAVAARTGGAIINADALQVYDGWRILTARPDDADLAAAPHRLYGHVSYRDRYSTGAWLRDIAPFLTGGPAPVIVGGTGLYFAALTEGLAEIPPTPPDVRAQADAFLAQAGVAALLAQLDVATVARIDTQNPMRVQRAWEVMRTTGRGLAVWQDETPRPLLALEAAQPFVLTPDKIWLNQRIEKRFDAMIANGALDEVRAMAGDWDPARLSSKAIGAAPLMGWLQGDITLDAATQAAKLASRQYAKRQRSWFRSRMQGWTAIPLPG